MGSKKSSKSSNSKSPKGFFFLVKSKKHKDYNGGKAYIKSNKVVLVKDGKEEKTLTKKDAIKLCEEHSFEKVYASKKLSIWKDGTERGMVYVLCDAKGKFDKFSDPNTFENKAKDYEITNVKFKDGNIKFKVGDDECTMAFNSKAVEFDTKLTPPSDEGSGAITRNTYTDTKVPESSSTMLTILNLLKSIDSKLDVMIKNTSSN